MAREAVVLVVGDSADVRAVVRASVEKTGLRRASSCSRAFARASCEGALEPHPQEATVHRYHYEDHQ